MIIEAIRKAYQAQDLAGSYCTAPLRTYNQWFQNKMDGSQEGWERTAWKMGHFVSRIFAYILLGPLALIGIAINLYLMPPENEQYSLWARLNGVPEATKEFCEKTRRHVLIDIETSASDTSFFSHFSSRSPSYRLGHQLSFKILKDTLPPGNRHDFLAIMEAHILQIQNSILNLSQTHGWAPESCRIKVSNENMEVTIYLPDYISV